MEHKGMGFAAAKKSIESREGVSAKSAGAILGAGARNASAAAKRKNPNLNKVKGGKRKYRRMAEKLDY